MRVRGVEGGTDAVEGMPLGMEEYLSDVWNADNDD